MTEREKRKHRRVERLREQKYRKGGKDSHIAERTNSLDDTIEEINPVLYPGLGPITQNYINYNYINFFISITITISHNFPNQLQLHCFNFTYNYIMRNQIYSAFVNYVFLRVLLNFNILYTTDKQT